MRKHFKKRIVSALLSASMLFGMAGTALAGGDTMPPREGEQGYLGENQPVYHGHRAYDVLNWSPETDEYASFMRAEVPLQERNEAYNAAQANPTLNQEVQALALMEDYGNEFFNPAQYNDQFAQYCFNFWQYLDIQASWHGTVTNSTPDSLFNPEAGWWERAYEFGVLNIPNPAYTNAAHKNGVKSIGCIFFPRTEHTDDWVFQDENGRFPMADKLVEIANYYGFDGYFINAEETLPSSFMPVYEEFCRAMTEQGLYIQVYASNMYGQNNQSSWGRINYYNKTAAEFSNWIKEPGEETIAANSLYMNPGPSVSMVDSSVKTMEDLGLDAKDTVFMTLEAGQTGFSGVRGSLNNTLDENLVPRTGIACLGAGTVWAHLDEQVFGHTGNNSYDENRRSDPDYQKYVFARERTWWSGAADQPYYANDNSYIVNGVSFLNKNTQTYTDAERQQLLQAILDATADPFTTANDPTRNEYDGYSSVHGDFQSWPGMAAFISERSVINGGNFYTSFNTGHGMQYFVDGKVSNDNEWYNMNAQDILPTWQWWVETESENRLGMDFDYGEKYNAGYDYIQVGGYEGPSSLVIFGDVDSKSDIHLYKTDLTVGENSTLDLTYNKPSKTDDSTFSVVLYLKDGDSVKTVYVPVENANRKTDGWVKTSVDLSAYAGETIAAFGFSVNTTNGSAISDYQMNLGEIRISDGSLEAPAAPTGLTIDRMFNTGEAYLSWDLADYNDVQKYNVYAVYEDGTETYVGGAYADYYYVKNTMYNFDGVVTFKVTAEGADGVESAGATVKYDANTIANLSVEEQDGALAASWVNPDLDYASIRADVTLPDNYYGNTEVYTNTFAKDATSGTVTVPVVDGSRYILRLSFLDAEGNVLAYQDHSGNLLDLFCANYQGGLEKRVIAGGWKIINPEVYDWWHMWVWDSNGNEVRVGGKTMLTRGVDSLVNVPVSGDFDYVEIQLEDFNGNLSERVRVYWRPVGELRAALEELIAEAEGINRDEYTEKQLEAIDTALETAKNALENATTLQELQDALDLLDEAMSHKWSAWVITVEATCETDGLKVRTCKCGEETEEEVIPALGHDMHTLTVDPTCDQAGYTVHACSRCDYNYVSDVVEALGHNYVDVPVEATCLTDGYTTHTCDRCGDSYVDSIVKALGHNYKDVKTAPTHDKMGYTTHTCSVCGHEYVDSIVPALGHDYKDTVVAPTCTEFGYTLHECTVCEHSYISDPVKATGHSYVLTGAKKPACGVDGYTGDMVCEHCGDVKSVGEVIPAVCPSEAFVDLNNTSWYHEGVDFVLDAGLMIGMDETHFAPNGTLTRGQLVTILHRMAGTPASDAKAPFTDVAANAYYADAVAWAYENGIVLGVTETSFRPNASVTREQLVTFLARYAAFKGVDVKAEGTLENFSDYNTISEYAVEPMTWAVKNGLVIGDGGKLSPKATGTRAQVATILLRYCEKIAE